MLSKGIFTNSIPFDAKVAAHRLKQPLSSQTAHAFTVVDSIAIGAAECKPHFQFNTGGLAIRRPVEMKHALGGDSTMDVVPDLTDIIFMLDLGIIIKFMTVLDYLQAFRRHVGLLELIGFHFSHNKKSIFWRPDDLTIKGDLSTLARG